MDFNRKDAEMSAGQTKYIVSIVMIFFVMIFCTISASVGSTASRNNLQTPAVRATPPALTDTSPSPFDMPCKPDVVTIYKTPTADLMKDKTQIGMADLPQQLMSDNTRFFSQGDATKVIQIATRVQDKSSLIQVYDQRILRYEVKKHDPTYEMQLQFEHTVSVPMAYEKALDYLRNVAAKKEHVVRVRLLICNQPASSNSPTPAVNGKNGM